MTYRAKNCSYCNAVHKKRGPFCGKVCSNKNRKLTLQTKAKISHSMAAHEQRTNPTPGQWYVLEKHTLKHKLRGRTKEEREEILTDPNDIYLMPQQFDLPLDQFVAGGDLWTEDK